MEWVPARAFSASRSEDMPVTCSVVSYLSTNTASTHTRSGSPTN